MIHLMPAVVFGWQEVSFVLGPLSLEVVLLHGTSIYFINRR